MPVTRTPTTLLISPPFPKCRRRRYSEAQRPELRVSRGGLLEPRRAGSLENRAITRSLVGRTEYMLIRTTLGPCINHTWENTASLLSNKLVLTRPSELTSFGNEWRALR
jgi:hypothetical protein